MAYRVIDLFSGAGGMSLGFAQAGFESVWALDNNAAAIRTYCANFGDHGDCADIEDWLARGKPIAQADVVVGGPPCQGFSLLNKHRAGDARRALWQPFLDVVDASGARVFVIENVPGLIKSDEGGEIIARARSMGFEVESALVNSADYGVAQTRKRTIILGRRRNLAAPGRFPPMQSHAAPGKPGNLPRWTNVRSAIGDLPPPHGTEIRNVAPPLDLHFGRTPTEISQKRYRAVPPGGNRFDLLRNLPDMTPQCWVRKTSGGTDLFGRLWWDRPSVTIRTEFFKPEKGRYLHPDQHRPITHREAARLMSFPDSFRFCGSKTEIARQIGNAVPPLLGAAIAEIVREILDAAQRRAAE
jgi:DNA (cytosine-5)-methyltransferase 1